MVSLLIYCILSVHRPRKQVMKVDKRNPWGLWGSIAPASSFEFLFFFITVQIARTRTGNNKTIFLIVRWETRGKKKKSSGWKWIFTTSAFPFKFRDLCCINYCKFALGDSQFEKYFFETLIVKKNR